MEQVNMIGIDLAKNSFQLHGARADGSVAFRKKLSRTKLLDFVAAQPRCTVAMEAMEAMEWTPPSDGVISARKKRTWGAFDQRRRRPWTGLTSLASIYQRGVSNSMGQRRKASRCSAKSFREKSSSYSSPKCCRAGL